MQKQNPKNQLFMKKIFVGISLFICSFSGFANEIADSAAFYYKKAGELTRERKVWEADKSYQKSNFF